MGPHAEDDLFGVERFAGVVGRAVFGATAAFDAGEGLEGEELGDVFGGDEAEVFIAVERRDGAEFAAREENGDGAQDQVEMLGVGDEREENQQGGGVEPPEEMVGEFGGLQDVIEQVGQHQGEDEQGDEAALVADLAEPLWPDDHAANGETGDGKGDGDGETGGQEPLGGAEPAVVEGE